MVPSKVKSARPSPLMSPMERLLAGASVSSVTTVVSAPVSCVASTTSVLVDAVCV